MRHHCFIENSKNNDDNLIITNFNNNIFPLIRYKNGDKIITEDSLIPSYIKKLKEENIQYKNSEENFKYHILWIF